MTYIDPFKSIVTTTKKNSRYYGPTESGKVASFLSEVKADINTAINEINLIRTSLDALASGYLDPNEMNSGLDYIKRSISHLEQELQDIIYTHGNQEQEF